MGKRHQYALGDRFSCLELIEQIIDTPRWRMRCDCGVVCVKERSNVTSGKVKSCGECGLVPRGALSHQKTRKVGRLPEPMEFHETRANASSPASLGWKVTRAGRWIDPRTGSSHTAAEAWTIIDGRAGE